MRFNLLLRTTQFICVHPVAQNIACFDVVRRSSQHFPKIELDFSTIKRYNETFKPLIATIYELDNL